MEQGSGSIRPLARLAGSLDKRLRQEEEEALTTRKSSKQHRDDEGDKDKEKEEEEEEEEEVIDEVSSQRGFSKSSSASDESDSDYLGSPPDDVNARMQARERRDKPEEAPCLEELLEKVNHLVKEVDFLIPRELLSADFKWTACQPGYSGCLEFSFDKKLCKHPVTCVGCGTLHPMDWSCVSVMNSIWRFHCFPSLSAACMGGNLRKDDPQKIWEEEQYIKQWDRIPSSFDFRGFDNILSGAYRWKQSDEEGDEDDDVVLEVAMTLRLRTRSIVFETAKGKQLQGTNFRLDPLYRHDHYLVLGVKISTGGEFQGCVVPRASLPDRNKTLKILQRSVDHKQSLVFHLSGERLRSAWQCIQADLDQRAAQCPHVQVVEAIGAFGNVYVLNNELQIIRREPSYRSSAEYQLFLKGTKLLEDDSCRIASAHETRTWVYATSSANGVTHPSLRGTSAWGLKQPVDEASMAHHLTKLHSLISESTKSTDFPEGQNYPCFLLTQAFGIMIVCKDFVTKGERHFPALLAQGDRRRGKSTASRTLISTFSPYGPSQPLIVGGDGTRVGVETLLGWVSNAPVVLDDTDSIKRDDLCSLLQTFTSGVHGMAGQRCDGCIVVNVNPNRKPDLPDATARRVLQLSYVGGDLDIPSGFEEQLQKLWAPLMVLLPFLMKKSVTEESVQLISRAPWWKGSVWQAVLNLFPHADERDHQVWLSCTVLYAELMGQPCTWAVRHFALAFQCDITFDGTAEIVSFQELCKCVVFACPQRAVSHDHQDQVGITAETRRLIKQRFFQRDGVNLLPYAHLLHGGKLVIQTDSTKLTTYNVHLASLFDALKALNSPSPEWRKNISSKAALKEWLLLENSRAVKILDCHGRRSKNAKMYDFSL